MDLNCELCANKKECFDNHWCVTMDRGRKINNEYICDNFELSGRKYEHEVRTSHYIQSELDKANAELVDFKRGYEEAVRDEADTFFRYYKQKMLYDRVIDLMAGDIANSDIDEDICRQYANKEKRCDEVNNEDECKKCVTEHYFRKARDKMNVFKMTDEEFEEHLKNTIDNTNPNKLLQKLKNCGLECNEDEHTYKQGIYDSTLDMMYDKALDMEEKRRDRNG